uniref:Uncharacterized protein n=1 Tax=Moniliophthora roreri TaxID=221103 RepID=A0A0W0G170_MONRR
MPNFSFSQLEPLGPPLDCDMHYYNSHFRLIPSTNVSTERLAWIVED